MNCKTGSKTPVILFSIVFIVFLGILLKTTNKTVPELNDNQIPTSISIQNVESEYNEFTGNCKVTGTICPKLTIFDTQVRLYYVYNNEEILLSETSLGNIGASITTPFEFNVNLNTCLEEQIYNNITDSTFLKVRASAYVYR